MKDYIQSVLELKGIYRSDDEYEELAKRWEYALSLRGELRGEDINESNIVLRHVPGGNANE